MSTDKRLQALFQVIGGGGSPYEIAEAVSAINKHLAPSGKSFRDLTVTTGLSLDEGHDFLAQLKKDDRREAWAKRCIERAEKKQRDAEIRRDVLATFVSDRVLEVAQLQAKNIIEPIDKGGEKIKDVANSFGRPGWAAKTGNRPKVQWGY